MSGFGVNDSINNNNQNDNDDGGERVLSVPVSGGGSRAAT